MLQVTDLFTPFGGSLSDFSAGAVQLRNQTYIQSSGIAFVDSKVCTLSFWMKKGYWTNEEWICNWNGNFSPCWVATDEKIYFATNDVSGTLNPCYFGSTVTIPRDMQWHHYAFAFSLSASSVTQLYIDGVSRGTNITAPTNTTVNWNRASFLIGRRYDTNEGYLYASLAEFYLNTTQFLDLSIPNNLAKFRNPSSGKPVNLGPDGSWVTGSKPIIYMRHNPATDPVVSDFVTNRGSGGTTLLIAGDNPSIFREPMIPSSPWRNVYDTVNYWSQTGWAGYTLRSVINAAGMVNVPKGQTQVRVTVSSDVASTSAATWSSMYIGHQTGPEAAAADLTQLYFNGSPGGTVANRGTLTSDTALWTYNGTSKVILTVYFTSSGASSYGYNPNVQLYYAVGDYSAYLATSGYNAAGAQQAHFFMTIEMV